MAHYLLDEDVNPQVAEVARGRGLSVESVYEREWDGRSDRAQLKEAARLGRVLVTYNRDDFRQLTVEFFSAQRPHSGVLIIPHTIPDNRPALLAAALKRYDRKIPQGGLAPYSLDFLSPS